VIPNPVSPSEPNAATVSEPAAFVELQPEIQTDHSHRELVASPQLTVSSESTLVISPQPRAYMEPLERWSQSSLSNLGESDIEGLERWSQFSLPILDESESKGEHNGLHNQRERSLASLLDDRQSLLAPKLSDRDDEHRLFPAVDLQDIDILSTASTDNSERRSFPEPEFRNGDIRDDQRSSEPRSEDDERRSFPTVDLQGVDI
jgi:hypothetical protein